MPLPVPSQPTKKTGPAPICECGDCPVCRNRERQRRFREKQKLQEMLGFDPDEDNEDEESNE